MLSVTYCVTHYFAPLKLFGAKVFGAFRFLGGMGGRPRSCSRRWAGGDILSPFLGDVLKNAGVPDGLVDQPL